MESMEDFASMLDASFQDVRNGDIVEGTILEVQKDTVVVDIHSFMDGVLPVTELLYENEILEELYHTGDTITVMVTRVDTRGDTIWLSKKRADEIVIWDELEKMQEEERPITVVVKEVVKGGLRVQYKGVRGFLPLYQIAEEEVEHPESYVGKSVVALVQRVERDRRNVVVSVRELLRREKAVAKAQFLRGVQVGDVYTGTVVRVEQYGAFVELVPGVDGLIHITELAWTRVKHPSEVVQVGDHVKVTVLNVDPERGRIGLRLKDLNQDPWANISYTKDQQIDGAHVARIIASGAFIALPDGIEAFLPISQVSEKRIRSVSEVIKEGDEVSVKVLSVDPAARRMSVSMRGLSEPVEEEIVYQNDDSEGYSIADAFRKLL